jgi:NAD dependent epimerase/dehydratase family enzyme
LCGIIQFAIENEALTGAYNAVAPSPVSNRELNLALGRAMYGKWFLALPVPRFVLKLMLGERSIEVLKSTTVSAKKIIAAGYHFRYSTIGEAMQQLVRG